VAFDEADEDGNGLIDLEELAAVFGRELPKPEPPPEPEPPLQPPPPPKWPIYVESKSYVG